MPASVRSRSRSHDNRAADRSRGVCRRSVVPEPARAPATAPRISAGACPGWKGQIDVGSLREPHPRAGKPRGLPLPVTPDDATDLPVSSRALNVTQSGLVQLTTTGGSVASVYIAAGTAFPVRATGGSGPPVRPPPASQRSAEPGARRDVHRSRHLRHRPVRACGDGLILPQPASLPVVSGDAFEGETLSADTSDTWTHDGNPASVTARSYQLLLDGMPAVRPRRPRYHAALPMPAERPI
jgi:hypothetical protein